MVKPKARAKNKTVPRRKTRRTRTPAPHKKITAKRKKSRFSPAVPSFSYLEHTGDIMIEARGPDFPSAVAQAAYAMFKVMGPARPVLYFEVDESALNRDELVVYFLSRVLSEVEAREMVPAKLEVLRFTAGPTWRLEARVWGESKRPRDAIKAVTFHELKVEDDLRTGWRIQVLLDV